MMTPRFIPALRASAIISCGLIATVFVSSSPAVGSSAQCAVHESTGGIEITGTGKRISLLRIESTGQTALTIRNAANTVIENLHIRHAGGKGIAILNSNGIRIQNVVIESTDAPDTGAHTSAERENIFAYRSNNIHISNVRLYRGSTGIYLLESHQAQITGAYGEDFRGPYPRGQFIQLNRSDDALIDGFYTVSKPASWPEDNINVYRSKRALIRSGIIDGNNAPNGVGIMFDGGTSSGRVEDVDTIRMGNGGFSAYDGTDDVTFLRTRSRDDICSDQGRGLPSSGGSMWTAHPRLSTVTIIDSVYFNPCAQVYWPKGSFSRTELREENFKPREGLKPRMCWEII